MADWYGTSRSNYFRVKDKEAKELALFEAGAHVFSEHDADYVVDAIERMRG